MRRITYEINNTTSVAVTRNYQTHGAKRIFIGAMRGSGSAVTCSYRSLYYNSLNEQILGFQWTFNAGLAGSMAWVMLPWQNPAAGAAPQDGMPIPDVLQVSHGSAPIRIIVHIDFDD